MQPSDFSRPRAHLGPPPRPKRVPHDEGVGSGSGRGASNRVVTACTNPSPQPSTRSSLAGRVRGPAAPVLPARCAPFGTSSCFFLASLSHFCHSPAGPAYVECALSSYEGVDMSYTVQYLQSKMAAQGLEVSVLVNCLVQDDIQLGASDLHIEPWENA